MSQSFKMALKSINGNKFRAFLTMLGIIIGVMALVLLVSLVDGATGSVTDKISSLGSDLISVTVSDDKGNPIKLATLNEWMAEPEISLIAPASRTTATGRFEAKNTTVIVYGTTPAYAPINDMELLLGRFIKSSDVDNHTDVCIISESAAEEFFGYADCLGREISISGMRFTIVGVLKNDDNSLTSLLTKGTMIAYIPYTTLYRLSSTVSSNVSSFSVKQAEGFTVEQAKDKMNEILLARFEEDEDAFSITAQNILEDAMSQVTSVLTILLGGIAAISLIVGGIGIMNIMLVTVTERTREIGIRKAIGATRGVILQQFLLESVVLCMMGCAIGVFLSWAILQVISVVVSSLGMHFGLKWSVVIMSVAFCFAIGVIFGLYPANKAAKMAPIDALHYGG